MCTPLGWRSGFLRPQERRCGAATSYQWILSLPTAFSRCSGSRPRSADSPGNWSPRKNVQDSRPRDKELRHSVALRSAVQNPDQTFDDVVDIGEVALHLAVIEHIDWMPFQDRLGKEKQRHIRSTPGAVDGKEAQARGREPVEMTVGVRHQLIGFLGRGIKVDRVIDVVMLRARQPGVSAVDA